MTTPSINDLELSIPITEIFNDPNQHKYYCGRCEGWYCDEETLIQHTNLYHEYWCLICNLQVKSEKDLRRHMESLHTKGRRCDICLIVFEKAENALLHMLNEHTQTKDKVASQNLNGVVSTSSRPPPSFHVLSPQTINRQVPANNTRIATPVLLYRMKNGKPQSVSLARGRKEYLCDKCNLKIYDFQEIKNHMMSLHNIKIAQRINATSGKEEVIILGNKGRIFEHNKPIASSRSGRISLDGGKTSHTVTSVSDSIPSTSNGHISPLVSNSSTPILPRGSIIPQATPNHFGRQMAVASPSSNMENRVTMINHNNAINSPVQNNSLQNYASPTLAPLNSKNPKNNNKQCVHCGRILSTLFSLRRHLSTVHKHLTRGTGQQQQQQPSSNIRIDRVLSPSEIQAFNLQSSSDLQDQFTLQSPSSQILSNSSEAGSLESMPIEVEIGCNDDEIEVIEENLHPPIIVPDDEEQHEIDSDSDMEIQVLAAPSPPLQPVPKPKKLLRVQPSMKFLSNLAKKPPRNRTPVNKRDIAEKLKKLKQHLSLKNKMMRGN